MQISYVSRYVHILNKFSAEKNHKNAMPFSMENTAVHWKLCNAYQQIKLVERCKRICIMYVYSLR